MFLGLKVSLKHSKLIIYAQWFPPTLISFSTFGTLYVAIVAILIVGKELHEVYVKFDVVLRAFDIGPSPLGCRRAPQAII